MSKLKTRPSEADRVLTCPSSALPPPDNITPRVESDIARFGTAGHGCASEMVDGKTPDVTHIARNYGVDVPDLLFIHSNTERAWASLKDKYPQLRVVGVGCLEDGEGHGWTHSEVKLGQKPGATIKGTADVVSWSAKTQTLIVIDWKMGYGRMHHPSQLKSYGMAAIKECSLPPETKVILIEVWVRHGEMHEIETTGGELLKFGETLKEALSQAGEVYRPGTACTFCPLATTCTARGVYLGNAAAIITGGTRPEIGRVALGTALPKIKQLKKAIEVYEATLRQELNIGGDIKTEDGTLSLMAVQKASLNAGVAGPILMEEYGVAFDDLTACMTLSKTKAMKLVADKAGKGMKKKLKDRAMEDLDDAGAVTYTFSDRIMLK